MYSLVNSIKQQKICRAFVFNENSSILIATCYENLKIFQFKYGLLKLIAQINGYRYQLVNCLIFMSLSQQFISLGSDGKVKFWPLCQSQKCKQLFNINDNDNQAINCMDKNQQQNLIITGHNFGINIWKKRGSWKLQNNIEVEGEVYSLTLNESLNIVLACGKFKYLVLIKKIKRDWVIINLYHIQNDGARILFFSDCRFAFQPWCGDTLQIYSIGINNEITLFHEVKVKKEEVLTCQQYFPLQFIATKSILLDKNQNSLILCLLENGEFINLQIIKFFSPYLYGSLTNDGNYLISWERHIKRIQIWKYNQFQL